MIFHTRFLKNWNYYEVPCEQRLHFRCVSCRAKSSLSEIACQTSTDNSRTSILSIFYSISNHKNFIPKFLDNVLADFAQTMYSVYSSLLRANRATTPSFVAPTMLGPELLTETFDRFQTLRSNTQEHPTTCSRVCKGTQHVTSKAMLVVVGQQCCVRLLGA